MARYQSLMIVAALVRASRRSTSPAVSSVKRTFSSSSALLPWIITTPITLPCRSSSPFTKFYFSSSSLSPPCARSPKPAAGNGHEEDTFDYKTTEDVEVIDDWEEEDDEVEAKLGDGGDGGGIVLGGVAWGERVLSIASQVLNEYKQDLELFAFRTSPRGYIYIRLDKPSHEYGCPSMDELEEFSREYKKRLDVAGDAKVVPEDLALEVSSPGAERLLKVPEDLHRFKEMPMTVSYEEETNSKKTVKSTVFLLESVDAESEMCIWKLADVKENRDPESKGRPLSRKQKDLRFKLAFSVHRVITLYLD